MRRLVRDRPPHPQPVSSCAKPDVRPVESFVDAGDIGRCPGVLNFDKPGRRELGALYSLVPSVTLTTRPPAVLMSSGIANGS